ncbi:Signal recognition particle subunit srp72 [Wickerhamiella sorbophila]|uniref:Signal recognition particle subunit SRP72 n=1 Tax=Wickerhamiella sorbophila TaxID=45607 RepID=A0A2T0FI12_9ASCO|nr:Signal recognition particle subunit srp72 [Wickerhamiella sorbophila]PRT54630.1 Signal recognition particle subunit srp72 [Wickerhamiella sorbophila]
MSSIVHGVSKLKVDNPAVERLRDIEAKLKAGENVQQEKLSTLIQLDRFAAAAKYLATLDASFPAEAAYIYYHLGDLKSLRELASRHDDVAVQLALSQAEYKAGHYNAAAAALQNVQVSEDEVYDLEVNKSAIRAQSGLLDGHTEDIPAFERHFNAAYAYLVRSEPVRALDELRKAKAEGSDEDQASVALQAAYAYILSGENDKALELLKELDDPLAAINSLVCTPPQEIDDVLKVLKLFDVLPKNLVASQERVVAGNKLRLQARAGLPLAGKATKHLAKFQTDLTPSILALDALILREVRQTLAREPANVAAAFVLAQSHIAESRIDDAAHVLVNLGRSMITSNSTFAPGVLGAITSAYKHLRLNPTDVVKKVFKSGDLAGDYSGAAAVMAESNDPEAVELAKLYFDSLEDNSLEAQAGKCAVDPASASTSDLPLIETLISGIDAESLDSKGLVALAPHTKVTLQKSARHRSGKRKLPASFDENRQPDPERWLAKQDRSTYKPKKKRGHAAQGATQGATQGSTQTTQAPPSGQVATSSASGASKKKKKNKKK